MICLVVLYFDHFFTHLVFKTFLDLEFENKGFFSTYFLMIHLGKRFY